jgi:hypothetical protein
MEQLRRERQLATAQLAPAERLREAVDLSDFCLKLAAKGREVRAISNLLNSRRPRRRWRAQKKDEDGAQEIGRAEQAEGIDKTSRVLVDVPYGQGAEITTQVP